MRIFLFVVMASALWAQSAGYRVRGVLLGDGGQPQAAAQVAIGLAQDTESGVQRAATTDAQGRFEFDDLPAGNYRLLSRAKGYLREDLNQHEKYFSGVVIGPGKDSEHIVFALRRAGVIEGAVMDEAGEAVRGASVLLFVRLHAEGELQTEARQQTQTDDRGVYSFGNLAPGEYFVVVSARPWYAQPDMSCSHNSVVVNDVFTNGAEISRKLPSPPPQADPQTAALDVAYPLTFFGGATDERQARPFRLRAGDRFKADVVLTAAPAVHVRLHTRVAEPQTLVSVRVIQAIFATPVPLNSTEGRCGDVWTLNGITPGHYTAIIRTISAQQPAPTQPPLSTEMPLEVAGDMDVDAEALARTSATVSGMVHLEGKVNASGRSRVLFRQEGHRPVLAEFDEKGVMTPVQLSPGRYQVFVFSPGGAGTSGFYVVDAMAVSGGGSAAGHTLVVNGGAVNIAVNASNELGHISGTVMDGEKPMSGAMVLLVPNKDIASDKVLIRRDQTNSDGGFSLPSVPYGAYTVIALRHGWEMEWANPAVLKPYLAKGTEVAVDDTGKSGLVVGVQ